MIRAICLNPAIDRTYYIDGYVPGRPYRQIQPKVDVGGKGINAAKVCAQLGEPVTCYGFIGCENGEKVLRTLKDYGIENHFLSVDGETRTTVNIIDHEKGRESEIIEPGPYVSEAQAQALLDELEKGLTAGDVVLCSGISACGVWKDVYVRISQMCGDVGAKCILDTNGANLLDSLRGHYLMIKPNARELTEICGQKQTDDVEALIDMARTLLPVSDYILVSMGGDGGLLVHADGAWMIRVPQVDTVSTIGSGDSTVAGFAVGFSRGCPMEEVVRLAMACGTANALTNSVGLLKRDALESILNQIHIQPIAYAQCV